MRELDDLRRAALSELAEVKDPPSLNRFRIKYLGRRSELNQILRQLKHFSLDRRKSVGSVANQLKKELEAAIKFKEKELLLEPSPRFDLTRPGERLALGHLHPLTKIEQEVRQIFLSMNFSVVEGPELETEYYNFDALNIPSFHPAREAWDTFWIKSPIDGEGQAGRRRKSQPKSALAPQWARSGERPGQRKATKLLLRTHTSPMQVRYLESHQPPFQIIVPGRVYRYEATDATHETNFYQLEGLMVGESISLANFKFVVEEFFKRFFRGKEIDFRFVPSYYPFVEPGLDVEIKLEKGKWLEVMGAGMVHPRVFEAAHYNPRDYQGFAFGMGIDRLMMIKYKVQDIRLSYSGDLRFIQQFG
jgi:phenylalanyl-tRNA synthetase alpha chain